MAYNDIRLVKLVNGETVLGKYFEKENKLKDVCILQTLPTQQGMQMILLPFGYPFENELAGEINYAHVLYEFKNFPEELKTKYMEASSNLTLSAPNDLSRLGNLAGGAGGNLSDISRLLKK